MVQHRGESKLCVHPGIELTGGLTLTIALTIQMPEMFFIVFSFFFLLLKDSDEEETVGHQPERRPSGI